MAATTKAGGAPAVKKFHAHDARAMRLLQPGREVRVPGIEPVFRVFPLGLVHLRDFPDLIAKLAGGFLAAYKAATGTHEERIAEAAGACMPMVMHDGVELLMSCVTCDVDLGDVELADALPAVAFPALGRAWIEESFGDEELRRPWKDAIETLASKVRGRPVTISEIFSKLSSRPDTDSTGSSTTASPTPPIAAGPSPNSGSGSPAPDAGERGTPPTG